MQPSPWGGNLDSEHGLSFSHNRERNILPTHALLRFLLLLPIDTFRPLPSMPRTFFWPCYCANSALPLLTGRWLHHQSSFPSHPLLLNHLQSAARLVTAAKAVLKNTTNDQTQQPSLSCLLLKLLRGIRGCSTLFSCSGLDFGSPRLSFCPFHSVSHRTTPVLCQQLCQGIYQVHIGKAHFLSIRSKYCAI